MLLIATDEAGYGPKLGPLVIAATCWRIPVESQNIKSIDIEHLTDLFAPLRIPQRCGQAEVVVDDSKAIYKSSGGLDALHAVVSASHHWCGKSQTTLQELLPQIAKKDVPSIADSPWLGLLTQARFLESSDTSELRNVWESTGVELIDVQSRVITAKQFNAACQGGGNKADLLSASTLGLVDDMVQRHGAGTANIAVYCDRHGGRKFYGAVLQHVFPDASLQIVDEQKRQSVYRLAQADQGIDVSFTVKGDSFTPVALSSMHAKYLRERFMESFNQFFVRRHAAESTLVPTAGYPVDADRFLSDIAPTLERERIDPHRLVRSR